jgi:hypothetical protein
MKNPVPIPKPFTLAQGSTPSPLATQMSTTKRKEEEETEPLLLVPGNLQKFLFPT